MADRYQEAVGQEDGELAELHVFQFVDVAGSADDGEEHVPFLVLLNLRTQVEGLGVLDSEIVQAESGLYFGQLLGVWLQQGDPDEPVLIFPLGHLSSHFKVYRVLPLTAAVTIVGTVDNHLAPPRQCGDSTMESVLISAAPPAQAAHGRWAPIDPTLEGTG